MYVVNCDVICYLLVKSMHKLIMVMRKFITGIRKSSIRLQRSRIVRWAGHVAHMGENRIAYKVFGGET